MCACAAAFGALHVSADVVETTNGARIVGKIKLIRGGVVTMSTDYAGDLAIKQSLVTSISTDNPVAVRVANGTRIIGIVSVPSAGNLRISGPTRSYDTPMSKVVETWSAGEEDPDIVAARRKWTYQAGVDITGRSGTHSQLGTDFSYRAKLAGPLDVFQYYAAYARDKSDGQISADQFKAGVDYAANFSQLDTWYVRDEAGFDRENSITFYDIAAVGVGHDFIKLKDEVLTGRVGLSYRYDEYSAPGSQNLSSVGADFGVEYSKKFAKSQLNDRISFDPTFQDLNNYILTHELTYEVPLASPFWKLGTGVTNNYDSKPVPGVRRLETIFFTRLVLTWGVKGAP